VVFSRADAGRSRDSHRGHWDGRIPVRHVSQPSVRAVAPAHDRPANPHRAAVLRSRRDPRGVRETRDGRRRAAIHVVADAQTVVRSGAPAHRLPTDPHRARVRLAS